MTSRERVLTTLSHTEPDRVPVDLGGMDSTGILGIPYAKFRRLLGITEGLPRMYEPEQQIAQVEHEVLERIHGDVLPILPMPTAWREGHLQNGERCLYPAGFEPEVLPDGGWCFRNERGEITSQMPVGCSSFKPVRGPLAEVRAVAQLDGYADVIAGVDGHEYADETDEELRARVKSLHDETGYILMLNLEGHIFAAAQILRGWTNFMMDLAAEPKLAEALMDRIVEVQFRRFDKLFAAVGQYCHVVQVADDLGMQTGTQLSPEAYRKHVKPRQRELYQYVKKQSGLPLFLHTDGSVYDILPDLIEIGVDILNPVQVTARDMDSAKLKKEFGDVLVFWGGGCDTRQVLPFAKPQDVRDEVKRRIDDLAPGGGFVFTHIHNIQPEVPPENIMAMYEAVEEFGQY